MGAVSKPKIVQFAHDHSPFPCSFAQSLDSAHAAATAGAWRSACHGKRAQSQQSEENPSVAMGAIAKPKIVQFVHNLSPFLCIFLHTQFTRVDSPNDSPNDSPDINRKRFWSGRFAPKSPIEKGCPKGNPMSASTQVIEIRFQICTDTFNLLSMESVRIRSPNQFVSQEEIRKRRRVNSSVNDLEIKILGFWHGI